MLNLLAGLNGKIADLDAEIARCAREDEDCSRHRPSLRQRRELHPRQPEAKVTPASSNWRACWPRSDALRLSVVSVVPMVCAGRGTAGRTGADKPDAKAWPRTGSGGRAVRRVGL